PIRGRPTCPRPTPAPLPTSNGSRRWSRPCAACAASSTCRPASRSPCCWRAATPATASACSASPRRCASSTRSSASSSSATVRRRPPRPPPWSATSSCWCRWKAWWTSTRSARAWTRNSSASPARSPSARPSSATRPSSGTPPPRSSSRNAAASPTGPPRNRPSSPSAQSSEEQSTATEGHGKTRIKQSQYKKLFPCQSVFIRGKKLSEEFEGHDEGVFAAVEGGVVARAAADLVEALAVVQRDRGGIGRAHLQEHALGAVAAGDLQQRAQQAAAVALALHLRRRAQVEDVRLARGDAEHRVAEDRTAPVQHPRRVAGTQAIAEDAARPRERIGATLHVHHRVEVVLAHRPQAGRRGPVGGKRAHPGARL